MKELASFKASWPLFVRGTPSLRRYKRIGSRSRLRSWARVLNRDRLTIDCDEAKVWRGDREPKIYSTVSRRPWEPSTSTDAALGVDSGTPPPAPQDLEKPLPAGRNQMMSATEEQG